MKAVIGGQPADSGGSSKDSESIYVFKKGDCFRPVWPALQLLTELEYLLSYFEHNL